MTIIEKVQLIKDYFGAVNGHDDFFFTKLEEIETELINNIETKHEEI